MAEYKFVTIWHVAAPIEVVWEEIFHSERWPTWWKGVLSVVETHKGKSSGLGSSRRYTWKSRLPYKLSFDTEVVRIEPPTLLEGRATGELTGRGLWRLTPTGDGTLVQYDWQVRATRRWMQWLTPLARPLFEWNHNVIMSWGAEGLAKQLGVRVVTREGK